METPLPPSPSTPVKLDSQKKETDQSQEKEKKERGRDAEERSKPREDKGSTYTFPSSRGDVFWMQEVISFEDRAVVCKYLDEAAPSNPVPMETLKSYRHIPD